MKGLISVIILNYNGKKWLKKCLDSLERQSYKNFEIILVDNASSDGSISFTKENYPRVILVKSARNLGFSGGNNLGIKHSKGEYILLLNNDTWIGEDFLSRLVSFYTKNNFDVIAPKEANYNGDKGHPYSTTIDLLGHPVKRRGKDKNFYLCGVCLFFSKELYTNTKGLDDNFFMYSEEVDWFWRLNLFRKKFTYIDDLYVYHAGGGSAGTGVNYNTFLWRNQSTLQMLLKNYRWYNLLWLLPIYFAQNIIEILFFIITDNPKVSLSYIEGWVFNIKNFKKIMKNRKWVQKNRKVGDSLIMKSMFVGFGKAIHMFNYLSA